MMGHGDMLLGTWVSLYSKLCLSSIWQHKRKLTHFIHLWPHNNYVASGSKGPGSISAIIKLISYSQSNFCMPGWFCAIGRTGILLLILNLENCHLCAVWGQTRICLISLCLGFLFHAVGGVRTLRRHSLWVKDETYYRVINAIKSFATKIILPKGLSVLPWHKSYIIFINTILKTMASSNELLNNSSMVSHNKICSEQKIVNWGIS